MLNWKSTAQALVLLVLIITIAGCAPPQPPPTSTPRPTVPTNTPRPTETPPPSPTETPSPTPTQTPTEPPTETSTPTATPTTMPTPSPMPITPAPTDSPAPEPVAAAPPPAPAGDNLLTNPSFEAPCEDDIPHGWGYVRHEWSATRSVTADMYPSWIRSGERALLHGGRQRVHNVTPGTTYRFTAWGKAWSSVGEDRTVSVKPAPVNMRVCINTYASQTDPNDPKSAVCTELSNPYDTWQQFSLSAVAQEETIVVSVFSYPDTSGGKHAVGIWDDVSLTVASTPATPTPGPRSGERPAPAPFDAQAFYDAMEKAVSTTEQMVGQLDRLSLGEGGPGECDIFMNWYYDVAESPTYEGVPAAWRPIYEEYNWAIGHAVESSHHIVFLCSGDGGMLSRIEWGNARSGLSEARDQLHATMGKAETLLGN